MPETILNVSKEQIEVLEGERTISLYDKVWIIILLIYFSTAIYGMGYLAHHYGVIVIDKISYSMEQSKAEREKEKKKKKKGRR